MDSRAIAEDLRNAVIKAAEKSGDVDMRLIRCLSFWGYTSITDGKCEICWKDSSPEVLRRVKKFAAAWFEKHYPGTKLCHVKRDGYKVFATYFSSGHFDSHACGLFWRVEVTEEMERKAILGLCA